MPIVWWLDKQIMIYPYNGISLGYEKNWSTDPCYNLEEPENKWKKPGTKDQIVHLYEVSRIGKSIETGNRLVVAKGWGKGKWRVIANGHGVSSGVMKMIWS